MNMGNLFLYELKKVPDSEKSKFNGADFLVFGPLTNMFEVESNKEGFAYVQVFDGKPHQAFHKEEILVLEKPIK